MWVCHGETKSKEARVKSEQHKIDKGVIGEALISYVGVDSCSSRSRPMRVFFRTKRKKNLALRLQQPYSPCFCLVLFPSHHHQRLGMEHKPCPFLMHCVMDLALNVGLGEVKGVTRGDAKGTTGNRTQLPLRQ